MISGNSQSVLDSFSGINSATGANPSALQVSTLSSQEGILKIDLCAKEAIEEKRSEPKVIIFKATAIKENVEKIVQKFGANPWKALSKTSSQSVENTNLLLEKIIETTSENFDQIQQKKLDVKQRIIVQHNNQYRKFSAINIKTNETALTLISFPFRMGKGAFKVVKLAADHTGIPYAVAAVPSKKRYFKQENPLQKMPWICPSLPENAYDKIFAGTKNELKMQSMFRNEPEFVQVTHSCIYQGSDHKDKHMIIMEFCEKNLEQIFSSTDLNSMSQEEEKIIMNMLHGLFLGVAKMQRAGVIHRDLKPQNVMVKISETTDSQIFTTKIGDFGFALRSEDAKLARPNEGSPIYMSPEILRCINSSRLNLRIQWTRTDISYLEEAIQRLDVKLKKQNVKEELTSLDGAEATREEALKSKKEKEEIKKEMEDLLDTYLVPIHGKTDVWACGLIIFEFLFRDHLYDKLCPDLDQHRLVELSYQLQQASIDTLLEAENFSTQFQMKLLALVKKLLILNRNERPDQVGAYLAFCSIFGIEPANYQ